MNFYEDRRRRGLSQTEMAEQIGVSVDVVRNLEATGAQPRWANARKVAEFYGTTVVDLWPDPEPTEAAA